MIISLKGNIQSLGEELIQKDIIPINELIDKANTKSGQRMKKYPSGWKMKSQTNLGDYQDIHQGGVYIYWWINDGQESLSHFYSEGCNRSFHLQGKLLKGQQEVEKLKYQDVEVIVTDEWLEQYPKHIPLYVGKSAESIYTRMRQHLHINQSDPVMKNTANQFRQGLQVIFPNQNIPQLIVNHIGISYLRLHDVDEAITRFYLEDYLIGRLMPIFNMDIER